MESAILLVGGLVRLDAVERAVALGITLDPVLGTVTLGLALDSVLGAIALRLALDSVLGTVALRLGLCEYIGLECAMRVDVLEEDRLPGLRATAMSP